MSVLSPPTACLRIPFPLGAGTFKLYICAIFFAACHSVVASEPTHQSAAYRFINIVDTTGRFNWFGQPSINAIGEVAFPAELVSGGNGVYVGRGGPITTIAETTGALHRYKDPAINDAGWVAFTEELRVRDVRILIGNGDMITSVVDTSGDFYSVGHPSINNTNAIAFLALLDGNVPRTGGIFLASSDGIRTIVDSSGVFEGFAQPQLNNSGKVVFNAALDGTPTRVGIYAASERSIATIVDPVLSGSLDLQPGLNDHGTILFDALHPVHALYEGTEEGIKLRIASASPFAFITDSPDINNSGAIVFRSSLENGSAGIYTGDDPMADRVIEDGDAIFGSTLYSVQGFPRINERGDIVFRYVLASGVEGIAIARVIPEPTVLRLASMAFGLIGLCRRGVPLACRQCEAGTRRPRRPSKNALAASG